MTQTAYRGSFIVHISEVVEIYGRTESGRDLEIYLSSESIETLSKVLDFAKKNHTHLGHAYYHIREGIHDTCNQCVDSISSLDL